MPGSEHLMPDFLAFRSSQDKNHSHFGHFRRELFGDRQSIDHRQIFLDENDRRSLPLDEFQALFAIAGFPDDLNVLLVGELTPQLLSLAELVFRNDDGDAIHGSSLLRSCQHIPSNSNTGKHQPHDHYSAGRAGE